MRDTIAISTHEPTTAYLMCGPINGQSAMSALGVVTQVDEHKAAPSLCSLIGDCPDTPTKVT
jgi:hypothetical protein